MCAIFARERNREGEMRGWADSERIGIPHTPRSWRGNPPACRNPRATKRPLGPLSRAAEREREIPTERKRERERERERETERERKRDTLSLTSFLKRPTSLHAPPRGASTKAGGGGEARTPRCWSRSWVKGSRCGVPGYLALPEVGVVPPHVELRGAPLPERLMALPQS